MKKLLTLITLFMISSILSPSVALKIANTEANPIANRPPLQKPGSVKKSDAKIAAAMRQQSYDFTKAEKAYIKEIITLRSQRNLTPDQRAIEKASRGADNAYYEFFTH